MKTDKIVIVGGGSAGWMSAATMIKAFPNKEIVVIESKDHPIIGVGESTLGYIKRWTDYIELDEKSFFSVTDASYKLSIKFTDFYKKDCLPFHYPFSMPVSVNDRNPFTDWCLKKHFYPDTPNDDMVRSIFPASALFENNKFSEDNPILKNYSVANDVAYHFDAVKFGVWLRENYCLPRGVKLIAGSITKVNVNDDGIESVILDDGSEVTSDLFIDCTGFKSMLLEESLKEPFVSYADMLPNNKAWAARVPYKNRSKELEGFTNCTAIENGWVWNIPLWSRIGTGYVYSDKFVSKEDALKEFKNHLMSDRMIIPRTKEEVESLEYKEITFRVGIHKRTFVKNVVAIGLAAGFIEPLESNGLFSVHEFLLKLIDILQRGNINQFDRDMYNVTVGGMFDEFAKFVAMHYALSHRDDTEYWKSVTKRQFIDYGVTYDKQDDFGVLIKHYMENWQYESPAKHYYGIPYIAIGMNLTTVNDYRLKQLIKKNDGRDLKKEVDEVIDFLNLKKAEWNMYANSCPTLEEYLFENFYKEKA